MGTFKKVSKRTLIWLVLTGIAVLIAGCGVTKGAVKKKVVILGIDGMDPKILTRLIKEGKMPTFSRLSDTGSFRTLTTSIPPQSPVAWSNFITGMNPGGHGIFDFIHRVPETFIPYLSTSKSEPPKHTWKIGSWVIPLSLSGGEVNLLRKGKAFWEILEDHGVPCTIIKIPANYPPKGRKTKTLSGMGTPDVQGSYGTFSFYTEEFADDYGDVTGGEIFQVRMIDNMMESEIVGPDNSFREGSPKIKLPFRVYRDPVKPVVRIEIFEGRHKYDEDKRKPAHVLMLQEGEWSDWIQVKFDTLPVLPSLTGICRFYIKQVSPVFQMYMSPVNIDPSNPAQPISTPSDYSCDLYHEMGYFYTQGMAEDTKALSGGVLTDAEYITQAKLVLDERMKLFHLALRDFQEGLLFFYFSSLDQNSHMFWRLMDKQSPLYDAEAAAKYGSFIDELYQKMDGVLAETLQAIDGDTTLMVMSDHGFAPFYRSFNLNTWLKDNGYIKLFDEANPEDGEFFSNVDWSSTKAYGLGINGLYINVKGREKRGVVSSSQVNVLVDEIAARLENVTDPLTGKKVIRHAYKTREVYSGEYVKEAPEIIVGYDLGYRASWETALGTFTRELFKDNEDKWSGDHCMATDVTPGVFLINKKVKMLEPALYDMTVTILNEFGIDKLPEMIGNVIE